MNKRKHVEEKSKLRKPTERDALAGSILVKTV